jgi:hypothetical protein
MLNAFEMLDTTATAGKISALARRYSEAESAYSSLRRIARAMQREGRASEFRRYVEDSRLERERAWADFEAHISTRLNS